MKLAWYHSHPQFKVDPSNLDLRTHEQQQSHFTTMGRPFFGVIIGPYMKGMDVTQTDMNCFAL